jgi:hypothetical protein
MNVGAQSLLVHKTTVFFNIKIVFQCDWFFSSWDEDVNVPVDDSSNDAIPISTMNQQLLAKAESLGNRLRRVLICHFL